MVFGLSKREREERKRERAADSEAKILAERKRRAGRRRGMVEAAEKRGYEEGRAQNRGGTVDKLSKMGGFAQRHVGALSEPADVGFKIDTKGLERDFDIGLQAPKGRKSSRGITEKDLGL